jgi:hypothetical protein
VFFGQAPYAYHRPWIEMIQGRWYTPLRHFAQVLRPGTARTAVLPGYASSLACRAGRRRKGETSQARTAR